MDVVLGQYFGQIRSSIVKKVKKLVLSIGVFHILYGETLLKHKVVVVQTPEWKFTPTQDEPFQDCSWMRVREGGGGGGG